jgi:hypothetical protein
MIALTFAKVMKYALGLGSYDVLDSINHSNGFRFSTNNNIYFEITRIIINNIKNT